MSTIKISELSAGAVTLESLLAFADNNGIAFKGNVRELNDFISTLAVSGLKGAISTTDSAPTEDGLYPCSESGTYTNFDSLIIDISNTLSFISVSGTQTIFAKVGIPISIITDSTPTSGSNNAVSSNGVFDALNTKASLTVGKNIYNNDDNILGFRVDSGNGNLVAASGYAVVQFIPIESSENYVSNSNIIFTAYYDINKSYISSEGANITAFTSPSNAKFIAISNNTTMVSGTLQFEKGTVSTSFEPYVFGLDVSNIKDFDTEVSNSAQSGGFTKKEVGRNLFDINSIITGFYINQTNGVVSTNSNYSYIKIDLLPNTKYVWSLDPLSTRSLEQFAFYNENGNYVSGNVGASKLITFTTDSNVYSVGLSILNSAISELYQLELGSVRKSYLSYETGINADDINKGDITVKYFGDILKGDLSNIAKNVIFCDVNGNENHNNLREVCEAITDASFLNQYEIRIDEGVYETLSWFTESEINTSTFRGFEKPKWVSFKGVGNVDNIHLKGELDISIYDATVSARVSTIHLQGSGDLDNIYVTAKNMQYAIHDDYNEVNLTRKIKGIKAHKFTGQGTTVQALGGGHRSGAYFQILESEFTTDFEGVSFSYHNNPSLAKGSVFDIRNNYFSSAFGEYSIRFGSLNSGVIEVVNLVGNRLNGKILLKEESLNSGVGIDYKIQGYGNTIVPIEFLTSNTDEFTYNINEICALRINQNASNIVRGKLVKETASGDGFDAFLSTDSYSKFYGITLNESLSGAEGIVQTSGYFPIAFTSLTSLNIGDKIGITSGDLAVVTGAEYIGFVSNTNYIKIK